MQINLTPDWSVLAIIVIFLVNYLVVRRFLVAPVSGVLAWRESEIVGSEKKYEESLRNFQTATSEIEEKLHSAKRQGAELRESLRGEANAHREQAIARVRSEAGAITKDAQSRLDKDTAAARDQIVRDSESLARLAAEKILGRSL